MATPARVAVPVARSPAVPESGRVEFYVLASAEPAARLHFACRLAEKVYHLGQAVHIHADDLAAATELDGLLWTFRQGSFVPHEVTRPGSAPDSPVTVGFGPGEPRQAELLINLAADVPAFMERFPRVAEIVDASDAGRQLGRQRFRIYRERGREPATHTIGAGP